jgi:formate-dependent nitrite reductase cytochrome c552 subunit
VPSTRDQRPYNVSYYARNREGEIARVTQRHRATVAWLRELRTIPCLDCGGTFAPYAMEFDHRDPTTKLFALTSSRAMLKPREQLLAEIAKCDIVCSNCHQARTYAAFMMGTLRPASFTPRAIGGTPEQRRCREKWARTRSEQADLLRAFRLSPCFDCGGVFDWFVMEFDHRDATQKCANVPQMAGRASLRRLLEELEKCDIVCSNCHCVRTYARREAVIGDTRGCVVVVTNKFSKLGTRVRFPPPAPEQLRLIEESRVPYRFAA